jgi:hypothetical protein
MTAHMVSGSIPLQTYSELPPVLGSVHNPLTKGFVFMMWGFLPLHIGWIPNSGFKVLWVLRRIVFLAKPSNFQEGVLFIPFLQWFCDTKTGRPKWTQWHQLAQILTFGFTASSLELVKSGALFPADNSVLSPLHPATGFPFFCVVGWGTRTLRHTYCQMVFFAETSPRLVSNQAWQGMSSCTI